MKKNTHIVLRNGKWAVVKEGAKRASRVFKARASALSYAYHDTLKEDTCMFVHDKNGKIKSVKCPKREVPGLLKHFQMKYGLKY